MPLSSKDRFLVNQDAQDQLNFLGQALSQDVFTHSYTTYSRQDSLAEAGDTSSSNASQELTSPSQQEPQARLEIRADPTRERRKGVPEVVFGGCGLKNSSS